MTEKSASAEKIEVYPSRAKSILTLLGGLGLVALCVWIATSAQEPTSLIVAAYVGIPLFGIGTAFVLHSFVRRKPALVIDANGITDAATAVAAGHLTWREIDYVVPYQVSGHWMLGVVPVDLNASMRGRGLLTRASMRLNARTGHPPVNIPQAVLPMTVAELVTILQERYGVRVEAGD